MTTLALVESGLALLNHVDLPHSFWNHAFCNDNFTYNGPHLMVGIWVWPKMKNSILSKERMKTHEFTTIIYLYDFNYFPGHLSIEVMKQLNLVESSTNKTSISSH